MQRKYRDRDTGENIAIVIPVIRCSLAQEQGKQYTKRLLPAFLIPRCVIRLDHVLEAAELPAEEQTAERACEILGCIDPRTARRRVAAVKEAINHVTLEFSHRRASTPELGDVPVSTPDSSAPDVLWLHYLAELSAQERAGSAAPPLASLESFLQAALWKIAQKKPSSCVSAPGCPP